MARRIGFIGVGHLGSAILKALLSQRTVEPENIYACDVEESKLEGLSEETGINTTCESRDLLDEVEVLFIAVKPQDMESLLSHIGPKLKDILVISLAAGVPSSFIEARAPEARVVRVMPNMPVSVNEMAAAYSLGESATKEDEAVVEDLLNKVGKSVPVQEELMDAITGLSGSGPAYIYYVIKAMAEGGVKQGLPEEVALNLAVQTVKGASAMISGQDRKPQELIDEVASPGGTTIEGLKMLDQYSVDEAFQKAVEAATIKSKKLSK